MAIGKTCLGYEYALELKNLIKEFDGKQAVDSISFKLRRGEILGLLGPNGAGKTTTLRMILNIIAPDAGTVTLLGQHFVEKLKDRIGFLPEERGLYRKMKVMETLVFFGRLKGMPTDAIKERGRKLLKTFDLHHHSDKRVEELSKGMAQKLQFITTIIHSPELLILDEPFSGLDPMNIELVKDTVLAMKRQGVTIIISTHLMEYAEKMVDNIVMIHNGKKVLDGPLSEVKAAYGTKFIKVRYDGDAGFVSSLPYVKNLQNYGNEMEIEPVSIAYKNQLLTVLMERLSINAFRVTEPSLNHIFIRKVNEVRAADKKDEKEQD
ncbi:MAG: ABC transporter ATP-binding protein [Candidatus Omnitrophota bacterium]